MVDTDEVRVTFNALPLIPFFDNSDATLRLLRKLRNLSPTAEACTNRIVSYCVGGGFKTKVRRTPGWRKPVGGEEVDVTDEQDSAMRDFVNGLNPVDDADKLLSEIEQLVDNRLTTGNQWLCLRLTDVAGERHAYIDAKDSEHVRYWATNSGEPKVAVISERWDIHYVSKYPPQIVGVYPNYVEDPETGDRLTLFHDMDRSIGRKWYGTPRNLGSIYHKIMEAAMAEFGVRGYKKGWTAKVILETTGDLQEDPEHPINFHNALKRMFTNEGEGDSFIHRTRLQDDEPMSVHQIDANTDHDFHESMSALCFHKIVQAYDWHTVLLSETTPGKLGQSKEFLDIYRNKYQTVIQPMQDRVMMTVNKALQLAAQWIGDSSIDGLDLGLGDIFEGVTGEEDEEQNQQGGQTEGEDPDLATSETDDQ